MLSIVVPIYNNKVYMEETLNHICNSTYKDLEIILVDDGSVDDGIKIAQERQATDHRIVIYSKENGGIVSARNYGAERAKGDFLCFMDQDDIVTPTMYENLISKMIQNDCDMGMCSSGKSFDGVNVPFDLLDDGIYEGEDIAKGLLLPIIYEDFDVPVEYNKKGHGSQIWTCIFRKKFWDEIRIKFRAYVSFEDDLLVKVEALSKAKKVCTISEIGYYWRIHVKSESATHKYVENIGEKYDMEMKDLMDSLSNISPNQYNEELLSQIIYCKQYLGTVLYSNSKGSETGIKYAESYFEKNIYSRRFDEAIKGVKYLNSAKKRSNFIFRELRKKHTLRCYYGNRLFDFIQKNGLVKLLKQLKRKSNTV